MKVSEIIPNDKNPRVIKTEKFKLLVKSIEEFPDMMELRPIVIDENNVVLGGNMRFRAVSKLFSEIPDSWVKKAIGLSDEQKKEFIIKDNASFGEWDSQVLANEWDVNLLADWGINTFDTEKIDYEPVLEPQVEVNDITQEQIEKKAKELAEKMIKNQTTKDVVCPNCYHEFQTDFNG